MATGDLKGNLRKIEQGLRLLNYPRDVDYTGLAKGDPSVFLPIISYCFTSFSTHITEFLVESNVELTAKNDLRFIEAVYKLLRDQFQYKPVLSKQQFLHCGFAERKIQVVCDIISMVYKRYKQLSGMNKVKSQAKKRTHFIKPQLQADCSNHLDSAPICTMELQQDISLTKKPGSESLITPCISKEIVKHVLEENKTEAVCVADGLDTIADRLNSVYEQDTMDKNEMEKLMSRIAEMEEKLNKLNWMEDKFQALEEKLQGKIIVYEKDWENLLSRVLLLETQLLLHSRKADLSTDLNNLGEENISAHNVSPVAPDREKEDLPESLHQSSGYSSLLSTEPSPRATVVNNYDLSEVSIDATRQRMERISRIIEETSELLKTSSNTS